MSKRKQGELESEVLGCLWDRPEGLTSQQILDRVSRDGELALTTILTVLSRLADKGIVKRAAGEGRALLFSTNQTREQFAADSMLKVSSAAGDSALALSHFADGLSASQLEALRKALK